MPSAEHAELALEKEIRRAGNIMVIGTIVSSIASLLILAAVASITKFVPFKVDIEISTLTLLIATPVLVLALLLRSSYETAHAKLVAQSTDTSK